MGSKAITNPAGAFGYTDLQTKLFSEAAPFVASAAVTAPAVVAIGTDGRVATAPTNGVAALCVGIAVDSIVSGQAGQAVVQGVAGQVPCDGAVSAGDLLKRSVTTAGRVSATATPAAGEVLAVAINASASNVVDVWVVPGKALS
jgi:hypothetical protein